jgi:hypothetical protein
MFAFTSLCLNEALKPLMWLASIMSPCSRYVSESPSLSRKLSRKCDVTSAKMFVKTFTKTLHLWKLLSQNLSWWHFQICNTTQTNTASRWCDLLLLKQHCRAVSLAHIVAVHCRTWRSYRTWQPWLNCVISSSSVFWRNCCESFRLAEQCCCTVISFVNSGYVVLR